MRKITILAVILALFFVTAALAQDAISLPSPGLMPDNPFYFLDVWGEKIGLFFAFSHEAKIGKALTYSEEKLAETSALTQKGKVEKLPTATGLYEKYVAVANDEKEDLGKEGKNVEDVSTKVAEATSKHLSVLEGVLAKVPEQAKDAIIKAMTVSMNGHNRALLALAKENPNKATEINLETIKGRLERAKKMAEEGNTTEEERAVEDFEELNNLGQEISKIAQGLGKDTTTVEQLVGKATSYHLEVLVQVYEKVPDSAKSGVEKAMTNSVKIHQQAVESLKKKNALDDVPAEAPIPEELPETVKKRIQKP